MTRAKAHSTRPEEHFGHISRAMVRHHARGWCGHRKGHGDFPCAPFPTWAEAMAYALGNDTKETKK